MQITILNYKPDVKNLRVGFVDFKVSHSAEKWEIFRNAVFFRKGNNQWVALSNVPRGDKWLPVYERSGDSMKLIMKEVLNSLLLVINAQAPQNGESQSVFNSEPEGTDLF